MHAKLTRRDFMKGGTAAALAGTLMAGRPIMPEAVCRELMDRTGELGLDGYVFQRTEMLIDRDKLK